MGRVSNKGFVRSNDSNLKMYSSFWAFFGFLIIFCFYALYVLCFCRKIDTRVAKGSQASRSGFCAIRSPDFIFNGINLKDRYNALELTCRVDKRNYTINLKPLSFIPDDLYQGQINHDSSFSSENNSSSLMFDHADEWKTLVLPFDDFALTAFGRLRAMQRPMREDGVQLINIGFMIADGHDGDFRFDLAKIRAINLGLH